MKFIYYIAEDGTQSAKGTTEDLALENFEAQYGLDAIRVLGVKSENAGVLETEIIWEDDNS